MEKEQETLTCVPTASETYLAINVLAPKEQKLKRKVHTNLFWSTQAAKYIKCRKASAFELLYKYICTTGTNRSFTGAFADEIWLS